MYAFCFCGNNDGNGYEYYDTVCVCVRVSVFQISGFWLEVICFLYTSRRYLVKDKEKFLAKHFIVSFIGCWRYMVD